VGSNHQEKAKYEKINNIPTLIGSLNTLKN
jgi:hypothetical protein